MNLVERYRFGALGTAILLFSAPIQAQSFEEIDRLSDISAEEETGIAAAREQAERGQLLEALATLERVMAVHPRSANARILHAYYLCAIDDQQGGMVEIDNMDEDDFGEENIEELRRRCPTAAAEMTPQQPQPQSQSQPENFDGAAKPEDAGGKD